MPGNIEHFEKTRRRYAYIQQGDLRRPQLFQMVQYQQL